MPTTDQPGRSALFHIIAVATLAGTFAMAEPPQRSPEEMAVDAFGVRVKEYLALHRKLEATLPKMPSKPNPDQIEKKQRALAALIKSARHDAKPGDFFTPGIQALVKRILAGVMSGPDGKSIKASIMDENPGLPKIMINERYPSSVPLSTMPPQILSSLPALDKALEYRFIGPRLILLDIEADIIVDFTEVVLPE